MQNEYYLKNMNDFYELNFMILKEEKNTYI